MQLSGYSRSKQIKEWETEIFFLFLEFSIFFTYSLKWNDNASLQLKRIVEDHSDGNSDDDIHKEH